MWAPSAPGLCLSSRELCCPWAGQARATPTCEVSHKGGEAMFGWVCQAQGRHLCSLHQDSGQGALQRHVVTEPKPGRSPARTERQVTGHRTPNAWGAPASSSLLPWKVGGLAGFTGKTQTLLGPRPLFRHLPTIL
uniref:Uncharacterized protein n=1 Tax=Myotis myotis TaxID=51298 RepID=A0A7J8AN94_MYOMY|nr:hypothetical protein mMyoMyo1_008050 [Myotis myotis]